MSGGGFDEEQPPEGMPDDLWDDDEPEVRLPTGRDDPQKAHLYAAKGVELKEVEPGKGMDDIQFVFDGVDALLAEYNRRWLVMGGGSDTRILDRERFDRGGELFPDPMSLRAWRDLVAHEMVLVGVMKKVQGKWKRVDVKKQASEVWLKHKDREMRVGVEVLGPGEKPKHSDSFVVTPRSAAVDLAEPGDVGKMLDYVLNVLCRGDERESEWLLDYVADMIQRPHAPGPPTAVVLVGAQGSGKGVFVNKVLRPCLGERLWYPVGDVERDLCQWSHPLLGAACVFLDERVYGRSGKQMQLLKNWVSEEVQVFTRKYQDGVKARNVSRLFIASNFDVPAAFEDGDRRFMVIRTAKSWTDDQLDSGESTRFYDGYIDWFESNVPAMSHYFLTREVDQRRIRTALTTDAKRVGVAVTDPILMALTTLASTGVIPGDKSGRGVVATRTLCDLAGVKADRAAQMEVSKALARHVAVERVRNAVYPEQYSRGVDGWNVRMSVCRGWRLPSPKAVADAINPKLPESERVEGASGQWALWKEDAS